MNRAARRQSARRVHATQRTGAQRDDLVTRNPIAQAAVRARIDRQVLELRTRAGLHAYTGGDAGAVVDAAGRLIYVVAHACGLHGLQDEPEARILRGCANALGDLAATPQALEQQRQSIISGLAAVERLMPRLHTWALTAGALELDNLLAHGDLTTGSIDHAVRARGQA